MTSAAAFVEGGIQDACDDACSICLEEFSENDPSTMTNCKHEFHLQCILEWCQRSSQCPMCWQAISLKDPASQELLQAVERERSFRDTSSRNTTIFHHPTLGDFELQHLPVGVNYPELEERIIQHLAAAAAMGRAHHAGRREGQRRSSAQSSPHFLVFSTHPGAEDSGSGSLPLTQVAGGTDAAAVTVANPSTPLLSGGDELSQRISPFPSSQNTSASGSIVNPVNRRGFSFNNRSTYSNSSSTNQERSRPSELQSFSESLKSRINAVSLRYKESISKSTRGLKERWFSRNSPMPAVGNEAWREASAGISSVSRMMEHPETDENSRQKQHSMLHHSAGSSNTELRNRDNPLSISPSPSPSPSPALHAASSLSD
ncbi:E3 ubiquitin-protein ligase RHF2A [Hibiscus syriacus]|uniref:RING-type E3 ubiquitin transferase n=2 Tax=Hibiscus syriacus TaxID=106335 RepID=A0A6A3BJ59_HIBSY|nr:E3 ubiquitin-protein ligase RHF2A-like isoform X2 [Hibiscus syriacus]XP_039068348.1 E3 ubiquitin-protein ligase RHF2A-like isoform X2 [Hibiscus syriacus]KAE8717066.1 E3 ubiquitin-protein ligase RHF2A [Hibiscus syriacus]